MALTTLPTVVPAAPDRPQVGGPDHPMRVVTRDLATDPDAWTPARAREVAELFDSLAATWKEREWAGRHDALVDALERGGTFPPGPCLEVGSGTGLASPVLRARFGSVVGFDLSHEMLALADGESPRVRADSSRLPVRAGTATTVALVNMFLFPLEVDRVLARDGALLWVNTLGDATPIHLSAADVLAALPGPWDGVGADAGWGTWLVARRA